MNIDKWSWLALMRFLLAAIVMVSHLAGMMPVGALDFIRQLGTFQAILGFLLISGYSIGASLISQPGNFYTRRALRIYPVYLASIALAWLVDPQTIDLQFLLLLLCNVFFLNQIFTGDSYVGPAWSLSLEVWLYALAPWFKSLANRRLRLLIILSFLVFIFYSAGRAVFHWPHYARITFGFNLPLLSFIWLAGFLLAKDRENQKPTLRLIAGIFVVQLALNAGLQLGHSIKYGETAQFLSTYALGYALNGLTLFTIWLVFTLILRPGHTGVKCVWMRFLGDAAYPLYLTHCSVFIVVVRLGLKNPYIAVGLEILVAAAFFLIFDFYSRRRDLPGTGSRGGLQSPARGNPAA